MSSPKRGGPREGAGRPKLKGGHRVNVTLDGEALDILALANSNRSLAIRKIAEFWRDQHVKCKCGSADPAPPSGYGGWVGVEDGLPKAACLAFYINDFGNSRIVKARFVRRYTVEDNGDDLEGEYDEKTDNYYWPEGWYEQIDNWDDYSAVRIYQGKVTHWMPLPAGPRAGIHK